jgi:hypothetical protein
MAFTVPSPGGIFNINWARSPLGAEYARFCVAENSHMIEDSTGARAAG